MKLKLDDQNELNIIHQEPKEDWETVQIQFEADMLLSLKQIEAELQKNGLTLNDLFLSILEYSIENPGYIKELIQTEKGEKT